MIEDADQCGRSLLFWSLDFGVLGVGLLPLLIIVMARCCLILSSLSWESRLPAEWVVCPWSGERIIALAQCRRCAGGLPLVVPCRPAVGAKAPSYPGRRRTSKTVVHRASWTSSIGVTRPSITLLLDFSWLWKSGTCPPLLQMATPPGSHVE